MIKSLDIGLYEDGYDIAHVDCIHNPVAAAAGYYSGNNYFYYCMLHGLLCSMKGYEAAELYQICNMVLPVLGLRFQRYLMSEGKKETIEFIRDCITKERPVVAITKYNELFYNAYYKNYKFTSNHGILVNSVNTDNKTFGIKETTLLRDTGLLEKNPEVHYSLQITEDMLYDMIYYSNKQFKEEGSQFSDYLYYIETASESTGKFSKAIAFIIEVLQQRQDELISYVEDVSIQHEIERNFKYFNLRFYNSWEVFYETLKRLLVEYSLPVEEINEIEQEALDTRRKLVNLLFINAKRKVSLEESQKEMYIKQLSQTRNKLLEFCKKLLKSQVDKELMSEYVDISKLYNNQAFEDSMKDDSVADITGEGTHFLLENITKSEVLRKGDYSFLMYASDDGDNISCNGQTISLQQELKTCQIDFLMCAEYGSYREKCKLLYKSGEEYEFELEASDFFQSAIYNEFLFWSGTALNRKDGSTTKHSFPARLFAKSYKILEGKISQIQLPVKSNIHIFSITLKQEQ